MLALLVCAPGAAAQGASPYLPLDHWTMPHLEYLIRAGAVGDPSPLVRPFRRADAVRALAAADTLALAPPLRRLHRRLTAFFETDTRTPVALRADFFAGFRAATHARRTALRDSGDGDLWPRLGGHGYASAGPLVVATSLEGDWRLEDDPDYGGIRSAARDVPSRQPTAYASLQGGLGELFFGAMDRNWGPTWVEGLLLSPSPYSYDVVGGRLGPRHLHLGLLATQLDDGLDAAGAVSHRYLVVHNLYLQLPFPLTVNLVEATVFAGAGRQFEPWFLNPLKLTNWTAPEEEVASNHLLAGDFELALPRWPVLSLSLYTDDAAAFVGEDEPVQGGVTVGVTHDLAPRVQATAFYTAVSFLSYRTTGPDERYTRRGLGIARNRSDYDQATLQFTLLPMPFVLLRPEVTLVRQGEGDLRQPFPIDQAAAPVLHAGVVERLLRLGVEGRFDMPFGAHALSAGFDAAWHRFSNAAHVRGASESRFVGALWAEMTLGVPGRIAW